MKTAIDELIKSLENGFLENRFSNSNDIIKECNKFKEREKQLTIDFASKCQLVRDVDCDGNVTFCFDPKEHYDKTFS